MFLGFALEANLGFAAVAALLGGAWGSCGFLAAAGVAACAGATALLRTISTGAVGFLGAAAVSSQLMIRHYSNMGSNKATMKAFILRKFISGAEPHT